MAKRRQWTRAEKQKLAEIAKSIAEFSKALEKAGAPLAKAMANYSAEMQKLGATVAAGYERAFAPLAKTLATIPWASVARMTRQIRKAEELAAKGKVNEAVGVWLEVRELLPGSALKFARYFPQMKLGRPHGHDPNRVAMAQEVAKRVSPTLLRATAARKVLEENGTPNPTKGQVDSLATLSKKAF